MEYITSEGIIVTNRIFVGSIPDWMCENKLQLAFQDLNFDVMDTRIVVDMRTGQRKGYGFVTFYNQDHAVELVQKGFVFTKDGIRLKIDTAVRKKGLQNRLQRQQEILQKVVNQYSVNYNTINGCGVFPVQSVQAQMQYGYPQNAMCDCTANLQAMASYQPTFQSCTWQCQGKVQFPYC